MLCQQQELIQVLNQMSFPLLYFHFGDDVQGLMHVKCFLLQNYISQMCLFINSFSQSMACLLILLIVEGRHFFLLKCFPLFLVLHWVYILSWEELTFLAIFSLPNCKHGLSFYLFILTWYLFMEFHTSHFVSLLFHSVHVNGGAFTLNSIYSLLAYQTDWL